MNETPAKHAIGDTFTDAKYVRGFVAWVMVVVIALTALPFIRRSRWEVFRYTHTLFIVFFVFAYLHTPDAMAPYIYIFIAFYAFDKLLRCVWGLLPRAAASVDTRHAGIVKLSVRKGMFASACKRPLPGGYVSTMSKLTYRIRLRHARTHTHTHTHTH